MNTILDRVKEECKKKGVSVRKMASDLGMSYNSLYKWKESVPDSSSVLKVANYLGCSSDYLLTGKDGDVKKYSDDVLKILPLLEKMNETELSTVLSMAELLAGKKEDKK